MKTPSKIIEVFASIKKEWRVLVAWHLLKHQDEKEFLTSLQILGGLYDAKKQGKLT